jgi:serpin B
LCIANGLWADAAHPFLPDFLRIATNQYGARLEQVDFLTHSEAALHDINDWVSNRTKGKIMDLFTPRAINAQTRLALVNAVYFKGRWAVPFKEDRTMDAPFTVGPEQKVAARLMRLEAMFNYAETPELQLLELPYRGNASESNAPRLSMVVLLPKDTNDLESLEVALNSIALGNWLSAAKREQVSVFLPRFKMTSQFDLGDTLSNLGMSDAFSPQADFSGMDGNSDLSISAVVHKAFIEVNEEGTEAAAATGVTMRPTAVLAKPKLTFRADHPFVFLIRDAGSGSILFLGRLNDPTR